MKILHVAPSFFPATRWGGPIFSTKAICDWVSQDSTTEVSVLTTDAAGPDLQDKLSAEDQSLSSQLNYDVSYCRRRFGHSGSLQLLLALPRAIKAADIVHLTGTYSFPTLPTLFLARILRTPVVWSPRGAIQATAEWAESPRKLAKRAFERVAHALASKSCILHVTAKSEADATSRQMPKLQTAIIPNSVDIPDETALRGQIRQPNGQTRLVFLSRVHEKKGILELIDVMAALDDSFILSIYGTGEAAYVDLLRDKIISLGLSNRVFLKGHVDDAAKLEAFVEADLFVLPTHSENFGIVIAEALAHCVPVITTHNAPWQKLEDYSCGAWIPLEREELVTAITSVAQRDLTKMGEAGRAWMQAEFSPDIVHGRMLALYSNLSTG